MNRGTRRAVNEKKENSKNNEFKKKNKIKGCAKKPKHKVKY